jgi:hypothetical protein
LSNPTEAQTRQQLIDPVLEKVDWEVKNLEKVGLEIPTDGFALQGFQQIRSIKIPIPPIDCQHTFIEIIQKYERLHAQQWESERHAEHLFQSLLHRAFRGEV